MLDDVINNANSNSYNKEEWKKKKQFIRQTKIKKMMMNTKCLNLCLMTQ